MRCISLYIIAILLLLSRCGTGAQNASDTSCTIATLRGPSSMGMIQMIDSLSSLSDVSIKVEIFNEPMQVRKMMIDSSADLAVIPTTMAALLYNRGLDYSIVAIPVWGTLYLFGRDSSVKSWKDLKGKRINLMDKGMTPDILFRHLLQKNGVSPEEVEIDYSFPTHVDLANAIAAERANLGVISEPFVSIAMKSNKNIFQIFDLDAEWKKVEGMPIPQTALIGRRAFLKSHPNLVRRILRSYRNSSDWVNSNPDDAAALIVKYAILSDTDVAKNAIPRSNLKFFEIKEVKNEVEAFLKVFYDMNPDIVGGKMPDENFYN